ncbi:MAG: NAD-dependent deacylase [Halobacteria archaeon]|nr:NAD-dependent deacylase [Halobacteria archaeon]
MESHVRQVAQEIIEADTTVAFTGAGISTDSGIPDFRGDSGIWERYDPDNFHIYRFHREPEQFWRDWIDLHDEIFAGSEIRPNPGHRALADLEQAGYIDSIITQNADGLHQEAGTDKENVLELHGNASRVVCQSCDTNFPADPVQERARNGEIPPRCSNCSGLLKPGGVLFGEELPEYPLYMSQVLAERSDVFLVVGSSLTVQPAADFPKTAAEKGATLVIINLDPTPLSDRAEYTFRESASEILPRIRDTVVRNG